MSATLMKLSVLMNKCCTSLEGVANTSSVDTMDVIISVVKKLPVPLRLKWVDVAAATDEKTGHCATFADLTTFVNGLTKTANSVFGKCVLLTISNRSVVAKRSVAVVYNVVATPSSEKPVINKPAVKCRFFKRQRSLKNCYKFKDLPYRERKDFLRSEKPCFECYGEGHLSKDCPRRRESKERCNGPNPSVCSPGPSASERDPSNKKSKAILSTIRNERQPGRVGCSNVYLNVVPVIVSCGDREVTTHAFLDPGSSLSFCERKLMDALNAPRSPKWVTIHTMTAPRTLNSEAVSVSVEPLKGGNRIELSEVVVVDEKPNIIPDPGDLQRHDYLRGVDLSLVEGATGTLLIGANFPEALRVEVVRNGSDGCPDAVRTPLGWSLLGPAFKTVAAPHNETSCFVAHVSATVPQSSMQVMFLKDESDVISTDGEFHDSQDDVRLQAIHVKGRQADMRVNETVCRVHQRSLLTRQY